MYLSLLINAFVVLHRIDIRNVYKEIVPILRVWKRSSLPIGNGDCFFNVIYNLIGSWSSFLFRIGRVGTAGCAQFLWSSWMSCFIGVWSAWWRALLFQQRHEKTKYNQNRQATRRLNFLWLSAKERRDGRRKKPTRLPPSHQPIHLNRPRVLRLHT